MTLANGRLYVDFGGLNGDCGQYHGYVVDMPVSGTGPLELPGPDRREGAIWETNGAVVRPRVTCTSPRATGAPTTSRTSTRGTRLSSCPRR